MVETSVIKDFGFLETYQQQKRAEKRFQMTEAVA